MPVRHAAAIVFTVRLRYVHQGLIYSSTPHLTTKSIFCVKIKICICIYIFFFIEMKHVHFLRVRLTNEHNRYNLITCSRNDKCTRNLCCYTRAKCNGCSITKANVIWTCLEEQLPLAWVIVTRQYIVVQHIDVKTNDEMHLGTWVFRRVNEAIVKQSGILGHVSGVYEHPKMYEYVEALVSKMPRDLKVRSNISLINQRVQKGRGKAYRKITGRQNHLKKIIYLKKKKLKLILSIKRHGSLILATDLPQ